MIVDDDKVMAALDYLNERPHPVSRALFDVLKAEGDSRRAYARAYLAAEGSIEARKAAAELDKEYVRTTHIEHLAKEQLQHCKEQRNGADQIIEAWKNESANIRAAEKVR